MADILDRLKAALTDRYTIWQIIEEREPSLLSLRVIRHTR
jgi:hypothetical protein